MLPERFPDNALDSVSAGSLPAVLFRYCQTQSGDVLVVVSAKHGKAFVTAAGRFFEHARIRRCIKQPLFFLEPEQRVASQHGWLQRLLWGELGAAFGSAALQNKTAGFRRHTGPKAVCAGALYFARLIRTFHRPVT